MITKETNMGTFLLESIRKQPDNPTREIKKVENKMGLKITRFYEPRVPSTFWFEPKRTLIIHCGKSTFVFVYSGIIPRWRFARRNEIARYARTEEGEHSLT